ncbi:MAG: NADH:flavin oxidoreductase [Anaerolineae bacterium]|nr:NADH:flavin oxidoreductase [Anaerolineae bacterium]
MSDAGNQAENQHYRRLAQLRTADDFRSYTASVGADLHFDQEVQHGTDSPMAQPLTVYGRKIGNRFTVLPMEGWDGETDGMPNELVERRWQRFGLSGAKLIWGGEAVAVRPDGRANPNQLMINEHTIGALANLREGLESAHRDHHGTTDDILVGLQLTHSGRFARPTDKKRLDSHILYHHPILDRKFNLSTDYPLMTDDEISRLIEQFISAAKLAYSAGFSFVDVKHCHGYLGHEFLSAVDREGKFGGSFENRTRFLREITAGIRAEVPGLEIGVRLSAFDFIPFRKGGDGRGEPEIYSNGHYCYSFGGDGGTGIDLTEPGKFLDLLLELNIQLVCITAGSPYYNPHIQRPAYFPPSDGYLPPEDPLVGVGRQIAATTELKQRRPELLVVGSGYSYLQEWLPHVAQYSVRTGGVDSVGLGRMVLAYPEMAADVIAGRPLQRKKLCRTFSDCTTAPRNGMISGCYPLDDFYKSKPEYKQLMEVKKEA